ALQGIAPIFPAYAIPETTMEFQKPGISRAFLHFAQRPGCMRIIGGQYGGRRINPPGKMPYPRPTTDIAKEGLFNILQNNLDFEELRTLDLFGGTGSISYELASRGVKDMTIVEKDP